MKDDKGRLIFITPETMFCIRDDSIIYTLRGGSSWYNLNNNGLALHKIHEKIKQIHKTYDPKRISTKSYPENIGFVELVKSSLPKIQKMYVGDYPDNYYGDPGWFIDEYNRLIVVTPERIYFQRYSDDKIRYVQSHRCTSNWYNASWEDEKFLMIFLKQFI